jgi:hypothetical protein
MIDQEARRLLEMVRDRLSAYDSWVGMVRPADVAIAREIQAYLDKEDDNKRMGQDDAKGSADVASVAVKWTV